MATLENSLIIREYNSELGRLGWKRSESNSHFQICNDQYNIQRIRWKHLTGHPERYPLLKLSPVSFDRNEVKTRRE